MAIINPDMLRQIPLFELLDNDELTSLAAQLDQKHYLKGQMIFNEGDPGGMMYVVQSGKVAVFIKDTGGDIVPLDDVDKGEIFGELSLLDNEPGNPVPVASARGLRCDGDAGQAHPPRRPTGRAAGCRPQCERRNGQAFQFWRTVIRFSDTGGR